MRSLAILAPLLVLAADGIELRYAPAANTVCVRSFTYSSELTGGDLVVFIGGQEVPAEYLPMLAITSEESQEVTLSDRIVAARHGRPTSLARTIDAVSSQFAMTVDMGDGSDAEELDLVATSPLAGRTFAYTCDADGSGAWAFAESGAETGDPAWLDGLVEEVDLRGLLPAERVERGDVWSVPGAQLAALVAPGGDLALCWTGHGADEMAVDEVLPIEGEVELKFHALESRGGRELARIGLTGRIEVVTLAASDLERVPGMDGAALDTTTTTHVLEGELLVDPATGLVHEAELAAQTTLEVETVKNADEPGPAYESSISLAGESRFGLQLELGH